MFGVLEPLVIDVVECLAFWNHWSLMWSNVWRFGTIGRGRRILSHPTYWENIGGEPIEASLGHFWGPQIFGANFGRGLAKDRARFRGSGGVAGASAGDFRNLRKILWRKMASRASGVAIRPPL